VILWFVATSVAAVFVVFRDPRFDYRLLIVGALLPDAVDVWFGGARAFHSVVVVAALLALVMLSTMGRRHDAAAPMGRTRRKALRRMLLGVPIGMLLHLVFDGAFTDVDVFWWPLTGSFGDAELPVVSRGWWNLPLEVAGAVLLGVGVRRFGLRERRRRAAFAASGHLAEQ
jgi:hypothetical protein